MNVTNAQNDDEMSAIELEYASGGVKQIETSNRNGSNFDESMNLENEWTAKKGG